MKMQNRRNRHGLAATFSVLLIAALSIFFCGASALRGQEIKNDRILAPEVSHFIRPAEPGVDAHGDLSLSIPLMTVPGRDGLDFEIVANYRSGIQVTQSASWIGLGWSLDVGSITRHPLGGLDQAFSNNVNTDFAKGPLGQVIAQPDVYTVNMNGSSTLLQSYTVQTLLPSNPPLPFNPAGNGELNPESGPCFNGQVSAISGSFYNFVASPWQPWKICYDNSGPVT